MIKRLLYTLTFLFFSTSLTELKAQTILWAHEVAEDSVADIGFVDSLRNAGFDVRASGDFANLADLAISYVDTLNSFDLIIFSKRSNSAFYSAEEAERWRSVTTPIINMSNYINRTNRLGYFNTTEFFFEDGLTFKAINPDHPIFTNTTLDADSITAPIQTAGFEVSNTLDYGNGELIAVGPTNHPMIVYWPADTDFFPFEDGGGYADGNRLWFASSNGYTLTDVGDQLFLDAVKWMIDPSSVTVSNEEEVASKVEDFKLDQNYPNPFNPTTNISYTIANTSAVQLKIFNTLGQQVASLVNEVKPAGSHTVTWNAEGLPSGVYIYQLVNGANIQTKQMVLIK